MTGTVVFVAMCDRELKEGERDEREDVGFVSADRLEDRSVRVVVDHDVDASVKHIAAVASVAETKTSADWRRRGTYGDGSCSFVGLTPTGETMARKEPDRNGLGECFEIEDNIQYSRGVKCW